MKNKYFLGIDVAKKENIASLRDLKSHLATFRFDNNPQGFNDLIRKVPTKEIVFVVEATGFYHLPLAFWLRDQGYLVRVINPLATKKMAKSNIRKTKTDKIDSSSLAWLGQLGEGYLFEENHLTFQLKILCRHLIFLKKEVERLKKHDQSLEFREVILAKDEMNFLPHLRDQSRELILILEKKAKEITEKILKIGEKIPEVKYLDSIPGISSLLACKIYSEIGNIERFNRAKSLIAFAGIDPQISQSGDSLNSSGKLSKRGSPYLRYYLFLAARAAIRAEPELKEYYLKKKKQGKHFYVCLAGISRKMLLRIYRVLKDKRDYIKRPVLENL